MSTCQPSHPHHILMPIYNHVHDDPRVVIEGASLARMGYRVSVVGVASRPGLPVYDRLKGMDIYITPMVGGHNLLRWLRAIWRWLRADASDMGGAKRTSTSVALLFFNLWVIRLGFKLKPSIIHCQEHQPIIATWLLARWLGIPLIYDAHESVPDSVSGFKGWLAVRAEEALIRQSGVVVVTVGERLAGSLRERGARRVVVVGNWKPVEDFKVEPARVQVERERLGLNGHSLTVIYLGVLQPDRMIQPLLEAVAQTPEVKLLIAGRGQSRNDVIAAAQTADNILWLDWVDMAQLPLYTQLADIVYYCLDINPANPQLGNNYYSTPNKLFEAFAAGKAMIARHGAGEIGEILEHACAGILLDDVTPETLKDAFRQLQNPETLKTLQQNALAARERYHWGVAEERLRQLYAELTGMP